MLTNPPIEDLLPKADCRYSLAMLVAKRARQLVDGAQPMIDCKSPNYVTIACEEVAFDKVVLMKGKHHPTIILRPEVEEARRMANEKAANQASLDAFNEIVDQANQEAKPDEADEAESEDKGDETETIETIDEKEPEDKDAE